MTVECKGCKISMAENESKKVADWYFCSNCFKKLLYEADSRKIERNQAKQATNPWEIESKVTITVEKDEPIAGKTNEPAAEHPGCPANPWDMETQIEVKVEKLYCDICNKEIIGDNFKKAGARKICEKCYALIPVEESGRIQNETDCQGCNRKVPTAGCRLIADEPYCPECYNAIVDIMGQFTKQAQTAPQKTEAPAPPSSTSASRCQSCLDEVLQSTLKMAEGFSICQACLATDAKSAVEIARKRHKQRIERMRKEMED